MRLKFLGGNFNTEKAMRMGDYVQGDADDPGYVHETLYRTQRGHFFLHAAGGAESKYPTERIIPLRYREAARWIDNHLTGDERFNADYFSEETILRTFQFPVDVYWRLKAFLKPRRWPMASVIALAILEYMEEHRDDPDSEARNYSVGKNIQMSSCKMPVRVVEQFDDFCLARHIKKSAAATLAVHEYLRRREAMAKNQSQEQ